MEFETDLRENEISEDPKVQFEALQFLLQSTLSLQA
jgi:hypothetical protein